MAKGKTMKAKAMTDSGAAESNVPDFRHEIEAGFTLVEQGQRFDGRGVQRICFGILLACYTQSRDDGFDPSALADQFNITFRGVNDSELKKDAREGFNAALKVAIGDTPKVLRKEEGEAKATHSLSASNELRTYKKHKAAFARGWRLATIIARHAGTYDELLAIWDKQKTVFTLPASAFFENVLHGHGKALNFTLISASRDGKSGPKVTTRDGSDYMVTLSDGWRLTALYTAPARGTRQERSVIDTAECSVARLEEGNRLARGIAPRDVGRTMTTFLDVVGDFDVSKPFSGNTEEVRNKLVKAIEYLEAALVETDKRLAAKSAEQQKEKEAA